MYGVMGDTSRWKLDVMTVFSLRGEHKQNAISIINVIIISSIINVIIIVIIIIIGITR